MGSTGIDGGSALAMISNEACMVDFRARRLAAFVLSAVLLGGASAAARADEPAARAADPGVARLSVIAGTVNIERGDAPGVIAGAVNAPILGADYVTTGAASRAEIQLDGTAIVRLAENAQIRFTRLAATGERQMQVAQGTVEVALLRAADKRAQIDTPSLTVRPDEPGDYRIGVDEDGRTLVTVRRGSADVATPQGTRIITSGTTLLASGPASAPSLSTIGAVAFDEFDRFNADRDRILTRGLASADVNPYVEGYGDLATYGRWVDAPGYGRAWAPAEAAGWSPYHDGRWAWEDRFGWTWIGAEPWGWTPYHYGRWFYANRYGWLWYPPGPALGARPLWSPALVGFFTFGSGGFGLGFGEVGWVPLAPFEPYRPWYGYGYRGSGYGNVVNNYVTNNITNVFQNAPVPNAITSLHARYLQSGNFAHPERIAPAQLRNVNVVRGALPVVPTAANLRYSDRTVERAAPLAAAFGAQRFAMSTTQSAPRLPFERQRDVMRMVVRPSTTVPAAFTAPAASAAASPATRTVAPTSAQAVQPTANGVQFRTRSLERTTNAMPTNNAVQRPAPSDSWDRFARSRGVTGAVVPAAGAVPNTPPDVRNVRRATSSGAPASVHAVAPRVREAPGASSLGVRMTQGAAPTHVAPAPQTVNAAPPARATNVAPAARTNAEPRSMNGGEREPR